MSDMISSQRITVRVPESLVKRLKKHADAKRCPESAVVREALENFLQTVPASTSAYDLAKEAGLIGCVRGGPSDLSTNRKHFKGFGEGR
jgi:predicted DNA-binding protein